MPTPYTTNIGGELRYNLNNPFGGVTVVTGLLSQILGIILLLGGIYVFVCLLWGGYQWLTAGDNEGSLQQAKDRLSHCLLGFTVLALSYAIALLVQYFLGIQIFEPLPDLPGTPGVPTPDWGAPPPPCSGDCTQACILGECVTFTPTNTRTPTPTPTPLLPDGAPCTSPNQCQSNFCSNIDSDGDTYYYASTSGAGICRGGLADCNDNNSDVHPNQDQFFEFPIPGTANDYDYNCDQIQQKDNGYNCQTTLQITSCDRSFIAGSPGFINPPPINCGGEGTYRVCEEYANVFCSLPSSYTYQRCNTPTCRLLGANHALSTKDTTKRLPCH